MKRRMRGTGVAVLATLDVAAVVVASFLYPPASFDLPAIITFIATVSSFAVVGALLAIRVPGNGIGWALLGAGTVLAVGVLAGVYALASHAVAAASWPGTALAAWITDLLFIIPIVLVAVWVPAIFPDGRLPSPRWRWLPVLLVTGTGLSMLAPAFTPGPINDTLTIENPFGLPALVPILPLADAIAVLTAPLAFLGGIAAVATRFRRGTFIERRQIKWLMYVALAGAIAFPLAFLFPSFDVAFYVGFASLAFLPVAIGMAVLRYGLYEIDRLISRTIGWAIVTGVLVTVFVTVVVALQALLASVTDENTFAVAASTLVAFALFAPLRRRVQRAVDRRFDRSRYDAQQVVDAFGERLRHELDVNAAHGALAATARAVVKPQTATVWIRNVRTPATSQIS